jgi:hypothetical protein
VLVGLLRMGGSGADSDRAARQCRAPSRSHSRTGVNPLVRRSFATIIRFHALLIAASYPVVQ